MIKLYVSPFSSNARRVLFAAEYLGVPYEKVVLDLKKGEQKGADYLGLNPNGRVPTLVDGDVVIWESLAILTYLAESTAGGDRLYPKELLARTNVNKWLFWIANHLSPATSQLNYEHMVKQLLGLGGPDENAVKRGNALFSEYAKTLDAELGKHAFIAGDTMTLADIAAACTLMVRESAKLPMAGLPNLERWFASMRALDAWKNTEPKFG